MIGVLGTRQVERLASSGDGWLGTEWCFIRSVGQSVRSDREDTEMLGGYDVHDGHAGDSDHSAVHSAG